MQTAEKSFRGYQFQPIRFEHYDQTFKMAWQKEYFVGRITERPQFGR